jgi:hypothetical protein
MTAVQVIGPDLSRRLASQRSPRTGERGSGLAGLTAGRSTMTAMPFLPLEPGIVNEAIPAFFIGRNRQGFWVAREIDGRIGGLFLFERSALAFARGHSRPVGCATIYPSTRFELDLENSGNALIAQLGPLRQVATRQRRRGIAFIGHMTRLIKRRLQELQVL